MKKKKKETRMEWKTFLNRNLIINLRNLFFYAGLISNV